MTRSSAAEDHTVLAFVRWLSPIYTIYISGLEYNSPLIQEISSFGAFIIPPKFTYLKYRRIANLLHIPVSVINCVLDCYKVRPHWVFCTGGVFYNGLSVIAGSLICSGNYFVRTAEDSWAYFWSSISPFSLSSIKLLFIAFINHVVLLLSKYVLTVGPSSAHLLTHYPYFLRKTNVDWIPGPVDFNILKYNSSHLSTELPCDTRKTILFVSNGSFSKGTDTMFELADQLRDHNLNYRIIWLSSLSHLPSSFKKYITHPNIFHLPPQSRTDIAAFISKSDFTLFATRLVIGYGQILLESLLLGTEPIIVNPIGDCRDQFPEFSYRSTSQVINRLISTPNAVNVEFPSAMDDKILADKHLAYVSRLINE